MIIEINHKRYNLPKDTIVTFVAVKANIVRVCFHWQEEHRSGIDIDTACIGMFESRDGVMHTLHCVHAEDAEEFDNWYKSIR